MRTATRVVPAKHYTRWAAAAAVAIAIVLAYEYPGLRHHPSNPPIRAAQATAGEQVVELDTPRAAQSPFVVIGKQSVSVVFVIPVTDPRPPYVCELRDDAGRLVDSKTVKTREEAADAVSLIIPAGRFHSGNYTLGIRGDREIPAYHFAVEVQ